MEQYKKDFIEFMVKSNVLLFGDFITKSGRKTPYFINTGNYRTGEQMEKLGKYYAKAIKENFGTLFNILFGPAYKGIPLVVSASIALNNQYHYNTEFCFNRKEAKDHGEKGTLIGAKLKDGDKIIIVEDVTTAGTSIRETVPILRSQGSVEIVGLIVSVDRMEKGKTNQGALKELATEFNMKTCSIVNLNDIIEYLYNREIDGKILIDDQQLEKMNQYRVQYCST
ncbi:orotate phosphoribosyltransferase [Candidatus Harpocratesius sp.]